MSANTSADLSTSTSTFAAPSFANFRFSAIGKPPELLSRMSAANLSQDGEESHFFDEGSPSGSVSASFEDYLPPKQSRRSLLETLANEDVSMEGIDDATNTSISVFDPLSAAPSTKEVRRGKEEPLTSQTVRNQSDSSIQISNEDLSASMSRRVLPDSSLAHFTIGQTNTQLEQGRMSQPPSPITITTPSLENLSEIKSNLSLILTQMRPIDTAHAVAVCASAQRECAMALDLSKEAHAVAQQALVSAQASVEAASKSLANVHAIQKVVDQSLSDVQNIGPVDEWNSSIVTMKAHLRQVEQWIEVKATFDERLRREAEEREIERKRQEEIRSQQSSRPSQTFNRRRSPNEPLTPISAQVSVGQISINRDASMTSIDDDSDETARAYAAMQEENLVRAERKRRCEEEMQWHLEREAEIGRKQREAQEEAAARASELARLEEQRKQAEQERAKLEEEEKEAERKRAELEAAEAKRKQERQRKLAEEEKKATEARKRRHEDAVRQRQLQARLQQQNVPPSQVPTNLKISVQPPPPTARKASISPAALTHPLPPIPTVANPTRSLVSNVSQHATLTPIQKPPSQGARVSCKPVSSGPKSSVTTDPRRRPSSSLPGSGNAPSLAHVSPPSTQHEPLPPVSRPGELPCNDEHHMQVDKAPTRPSLPPITSSTSNASNPSSKRSTPFPATPSPVSPEDQEMSVHSHGGDLGNLDFVPVSKMMPISPAAQRANLRKVAEESASRVKREASEGRVKEEEEDSYIDYASGQAQRRSALSGGVKIAIPSKSPKVEIQSPIVTSGPPPSQQQERHPPPSSQPSTANQPGASQVHQHPPVRTPAPTASHPPLPTRLGKNPRDPRLIAVSTSQNDLSTPSLPKAQLISSSTSMPLPSVAVKASPPASGNTSTVAPAAAETARNLQVPPSQVPTSSPSSTQDGMGPDPMTTGGWSQSGGGHPEDDHADSSREPAQPQPASRGRQYDHYSPSPPIERVPVISRRPSGSMRRVDHYSPPPPQRPKSPLYRGRRSPPPGSRPIPSNNRAVSPRLRARDRSASPRPHAPLRPSSRDGPPPVPLAGRKRTRDEEVPAAPPPRRSRYLDGREERAFNGAYEEEWSRMADYTGSPSAETPTTPALARRIERTPIPQSVVTWDQTSNGGPLRSRIDPTPEPANVPSHNPSRQPRPYHERGGFPQRGSRHHAPSSYSHPGSQYEGHPSGRRADLLSRLSDDMPMNGDTSTPSYPPSASYRGHSPGRGRGRGAGRGYNGGRHPSSNALLNRLEPSNDYP